MLRLGWTCKKFEAHLRVLLQHLALRWDEAEVVLPGSSRGEEEEGQEAGSGGFAAQQSTRAVRAGHSAKQIAQSVVVPAFRNGMRESRDHKLLVFS